MFIAPTPNIFLCPVMLLVFFINYVSAPRMRLFDDDVSMKFIGWEKYTIGFYRFLHDLTQLQPAV
jgi:hypothetical protein